MKFVIAVCLSVMLAACSLNHTSEPSRFYALGTPSVQQVRGPTVPINIVIENVSVPQSVDRPQIVVKKSESNMLIVSEFDRWIEELTNALPVVISENMNMYAKNVNARPKRNSGIAGNVKYIVGIDFVKFDTESDGKITLSAWWTVSNNRGEVLVQKKTTQTTDTPDMESGRPNYDAIVSAQSNLIAKLSYKIADVITELK